MADLFDATRCILGEGAFWHPQRQSLFWVDILGQRLHGETRARQIDGTPSAMGWIDRDTLFLATDTALGRYDLRDGIFDPVVALEHDRPDTRSNDGRADPWGGFWIGTMGRNAEARAGAIYRYHRGTLKRLHAQLTIPNAICFAPDTPRAYFADTARQTVWSQALDPTSGWPDGDPELFLDLSAQGLNPDGAVTDADGNLWIAQWGAGRVAAYDPGGAFLHAIPFPAPQTSCPAFGGPDYATLYCTTALEGLDPDTHATSGQTFSAPVQAQGRPEPRVIL